MKKSFFMLLVIIMTLVCSRFVRSVGKSSDVVVAASQIDEDLITEKIQLYNYVPQQEGTFTFIFANDTANNWNYTNITFTIDLTKPTPNIVSPTNMSYNYTNIDLNVFADENISSWWYSLNGAANVTFSPNTTISGIEGINTLFIYANDTVDNLNYTNITFTVDLTKPTLEIFSPESITYRRDQIALNVDAVNSLSEVAIRTLSINSPIFLSSLPVVI